MTYYEQLVIDPDAPADRESGARRRRWPPAVQVARPAPDARERTPQDERAARTSLRFQIARLERERSAIVAERFPFIAAPAPVAPGAASGPALLDLGALERVRDELAADVQELRARVHERVEHERRAREQLRRMRLEPGRYKFARLPVRDLGQGVCGAWVVRPRLGLIGMLAGWWELKLASGCPLARGSRSTRGPCLRR
ncbi:MAG TPA: hypothetical protein VMF09_14770 [Solirubrobacteraceae bacterium]|nr:hypothetical protein [Solirubrobacteraceae bacterium]